MPRTNPSVGPIEIQRAVLLPISCSTSRVRSIFLSGSSILTALYISGVSDSGNLISTHRAYYLQWIAFCHGYPFSASTDADISRTSFVIANCLALLRASVNCLVRSSALSVAVFIASIRLLPR